MVSAVAPRLAIATGLDTQGLSRDPEVIRRYEQDPFIEDRMSVRFAAGMSQMVDAIRVAPEQIERPILILHGGADPICPAQGSRQLFAGLAPEITSRSAIEIYPDLRHEIFNEPERERIWQDMLRFVESCPPHR